MGHKGFAHMHRVTSENANCGLERLPPEVLLPILTRLPDLDSLDNLLQISPAAAQLFDLRGVEIFEAVLSADTNTHEYTRALIRIVALLRSTALPAYIHDWISFEDLVRDKTTSYRYNPSRWNHPPLRLPPHTSTVALREVLATNQKIRRLTIDCLRYYIERFRALRPSHLADETFRYDTKNNSNDEDYVRPWQLKPAVIPYSVKDIGGPTWLEQQRVLRALWRIRLFHEFKNSIGTSCITWTENDISQVRNMNLDQLYDVPDFVYSDEDDCGYSLVNDISPRVNETDTLLEYEIIQSAIDFLQEGREAIGEPIYQELKIDWAASDLLASEDIRNHDSLDDCVNSPMWYFFHELNGNSTGTLGQHIWNFSSPLQHIHFSPFRRLGFAIWSQERLQGYGLLQVPRCLTAEDTYVCMSDSAPVYTAWRSILTTDERAEIERVNDWWVKEAKTAQEYDPDENRRRQQAAMMLEEEKEEDMGPPVVDWKEHYRRQKKRIQSGTDEENTDGDHDMDTEDHENPGSVGTASERP
jgi:hypothetical protein